MAKKKLGLSSTLNKNKKNEGEPKLANKIPLPKNSKKTEEIKKKVEAIHQTQEMETTISSKPLKKSKKNVRITVDTPQDIHIKLKIKSIEAGITMREYILRLINADLNS